MGEWLFRQPEIGENIDGKLPPLFAEAGLGDVLRLGHDMGYVTTFALRKGPPRRDRAGDLEPGRRMGHTLSRHAVGRNRHAVRRNGERFSETANAMKLCIVGVRGHAGYVFDGLADLPGVQVVGVSAGCGEDDVGVLTSECDRLGQRPEVFGDYLQMLDACSPDVAAIAGPFEQHARMCLAAFDRGIHVFCEKPVALTLAELASLRAAHAGTDVHFAAMMGLRYDRAFYAAHCAVQDGAVGEVRLINTRKSYKLGRRASYYHTRATYGGTIPWVGSHAIDWIHWFADRPFESVYATHSARCNDDHGELETSALCQFTLAGEVLASASIDYYRPERAPTHGDDRVRVVGTGGVVEVADGRATLIDRTSDGAQTLSPCGDRQIFRDFVDHVEGRTTALIGADETFAVAEACLLARQSADEGRVITFGGDEGVDG